MDVLKLATDWARTEVFSTRFFILFAIGFILASIGFWQLGKTDIAKSYIIPTLVDGILLMIIGTGLFYTNKVRITQFKKAYQENKTLFIQSEIQRAENTLKEYDTIVFKVIPILIMLAAIGIIVFSSPFLRAISITTIAMLIVILLVDGTAHERIAIYHKQLQKVSKL